MSQYGRTDYWDERYSKNPEPFDWLQRYQGVKENITKYIQPESKILNIGAGNSRMSEDMYDEGYINILNIDISSTVIKQMQEKYKDRGQNLKYQQMDARQMDFQDASFDMIIDKATFDSIICGENSTKNINKLLTEVSRILKQNGYYIIISYGQPDYRLPYLQKSEYNWEITVEQINKPTISTSITIQADDKDSPNVHFIYICKKNTTSNQTDSIQQ